MGKLLVLFTAIPLLEFYLLVQLSDWLGVFATIALVLITGAVGAMLARAEGLRVLRSWQAALAAERVPEDGVVSGLLVLVGGVLLVTPGVLTDAVGLMLLVPATRRFIAQQVTGHLQREIERGRIHVRRAATHATWVDVSSAGFSGGTGFPPRPGYRPPRPPRPDRPRVIEVEARVIDSKDV